MDSFSRRRGVEPSHLPHLLDAQAFIPPTERVEMAGFDFPGDNNAIRAEVMRRLNSTPAYRSLFGQGFLEVRRGRPIDYDMFVKVTAEFEFALVLNRKLVERFADGEELLVIG